MNLYMVFLKNGQRGLVVAHDEKSATRLWHDEYLPPVDRYPGGGVKHIEIQGEIKSLEVLPHVVRSVEQAYAYGIQISKQLEALVKGGGK